MKRYFNLDLKGVRLFLIYVLTYIVVYAFLFIYFGILGVSMAGAAGAPEPHMTGPMAFSLFLLIFIYVVAIYGLCFFVVRLYVDNLSLGGDKFSTDYDLKQYMLEIVLGSFLTIITLGIYGPWFSKRIRSLFVDNTSLKGEKLLFNGSGSTLLRYIVLGFVLPLIATSVVAGIAMTSAGPGPGPFLILLIFYVVIFFCASVTQFLTCKWAMDIDMEGCTFRLDGKWLDGGLFMLGQVVLSVVTLGLYGPAARLRIFRYLAGRTVGVRDGRVVARVGCEVTMGEDYLYLLGQMLLAIITLGIYLAWAEVNISKRIAGKTFIESDAAAE